MATERNDILHRMTADLRSTGIFHCDTRLAAGHALDLPEMPGIVMFHLVLRGECTVHAGGRSERLTAGTVALLPHGQGHRVATGESHVVALEDTERPLLGGIVERLDLGHGPVAAHLVCGALTLEHPAAPALPAVLDTLVVVRPDDDAEPDRARMLADLVLEEALAAGPGWLESTSRLVDVVAMRAVRQALCAAPSAPGWWTAVQDPRLATAIRAVIDAPSTPWTLPGLAGAAAMSRSAFAQLFRERVGEAPMAWVARYRMGVARGLLEKGEPVSLVARGVGYDSEVAFRRAFSRIVGTPPGTVQHRR